MCLAAARVNNAIFGYSFHNTQNNTPTTPLTSEDTITISSEGDVTIHTAVLSDTQGYAGKTPLDIKINKEEIITEITPLDNEETPGFFNRAKELLKPLIGKKVKEIPEIKIDAVSGATYSSNALIQNLNAGLEFYSDSEAAKSTSEIPLKVWIALSVILTACIVPLFIKNRYYLTAQLIANVIVLGVWCGEFLDYYLILKYLSFGFTFPVGLAAILMIIAAFVYPLFGKPQHYCNYICPLGSAQTLLGKISHKKLTLSAKLVKTLNLLRKVIWATLMILLWLDVATEWMDYELFQIFLPSSAPISVIVVASIFLILSTVIHRPYCRFVCPTGSLIKRCENID